MLTVNPPIHPGEFLREEFMAPLGLSAGKIAEAIGVPRTRIERLMREEVALTPDTAARLGRYFGTGTEFWLNIRASYDLSWTALDRDLQAELDAIVPLPRPDLDGPIPFAEDGDEAA